MERKKNHIREGGGDKIENDGKKAKRKRRNESGVKIGKGDEEEGVGRLKEEWKERNEEEEKGEGERRKERQWNESKWGGWRREEINEKKIREEKLREGEKGVGGRQKFPLLAK